MKSTLIDRITAMSSSPIDWVWYSDYYDGPLEGWIQVKGRRYYYHILNDPLHCDRLYAVYNVPRAIRVPHLLSHRRWRQIVGWNHDRRPGEPRRDAKPNIMDNFYRYEAEKETYDLPDMDYQNPQSGYPWTIYRAAAVPEMFVGTV